MPSTHCKLIRISGAAFKTLQSRVDDQKYSPKRREGFLIQNREGARLEGRYMYLATQKIKGTNPETLEEEVTEQPTMVTCTFAVNSRNNLVRCNERRRDLQLMEDVFNTLEGVRVEMEDVNTDPVEIYRTLRDAHGKVDLRSMRIRDYLGREGLMATANFKLMEPGAEDKILDQYREACQAFTAAVIVDGTRQSITVTRNGSIRASDELPIDLFEMALNLLTQFHESAGVEMVEA